MKIPEPPVFEPTCLFRRFFPKGKKGVFYLQQAWRRFDGTITWKEIEAYYEE
jgi:hypothetical protein|tara:strand:- start:4325 stop:4480 length:156 start_codon:yes stop_codon:yes gene_type:complete